MPISADEISKIRGWVGTNASDPTNLDISSRWDRLGDVVSVAEEIMRERLANLLLRAAKFDVTGDASIDLTANITATEETVRLLEGITGSTLAKFPPVTFGQLLRPDWDR